MYKKSDFFYELPKDLIAQTPANPRDSSRLLVYNKATSQIEHKQFFDIEGLLTCGDVLVVNSTKVIPARIFAKTKNGGKVELLLLQKQAEKRYEVMVKPGKKALVGSTLYISDKVCVNIIDKTASGGRIAEFICECAFEEELDKIGTMPLPPYITQKLEESARYQTVYCNQLGSSAAPTAGLHFTNQLLERLKNKGVIIAEVLLHVGLGTFRPVKADSLNEHIMHSEYFCLSQETADIINNAKAQKRRVIAVGTTSVRVLESLASPNGLVKAASGQTDIFIYPPYKFKCVDALITNFHLPESTLIMLVSAFAGYNQTLSLYKTAVNQKYRFFSFGDAMYIY